MEKAISYLYTQLLQQGVLNPEKSTLEYFQKLVHGYLCKEASPALKETIQKAVADYTKKINSEKLVDVRIAFNEENDMFIEIMRK